MGLWMGFGQPRPSPVKLPVSTDGCNVTLEAFNQPLQSFSRNDEQTYVSPLT